MKHVGPVVTALCVMLLGPAFSADGAEKPGDAPKKRTVYAWFPRQFGNFDTRAIDWSALTHLSFRSVVIQRDGTLQEVVPRAKVKRLVDEAHAHGVRVSVLVWGTSPPKAAGAEHGAHSSQYLARHQDQVVRGLSDYVKANNLDAVDLDDETWRQENTVSGGSNRELVTEFFRKLNKAFKAARPDYQVFWASPPVIAAQDKYGAAWPDYKAIAELIDGFCIMSYCMCPPTVGWTGGAQPVRGGGKVSGHARDYAACIDDYLAATGGRKDKLLLGIANDLGGTEWTCRSDQPLSPIIGKPRKLDAQEARANAQKHGRKFDPQQQTPWYCYRGEKGWVQGWYEDDESLAAKLDLVRAQGLQGVCVWVLDGAQEPPSTFQLLRKHLHGK
jgi:GH18 family chitinase